MRLFGTVTGAITVEDRAGWITRPFDLPFMSILGEEEIFDALITRQIFRVVRIVTDRDFDEVER